ncbi:hypothetical protein ABEB36_007473 [Hypothenemus hampei]|uniref:Uncharacterized protein n=1 Tax=Hypothenemus hampei TaxID=57062 RepID=A0ABD1EU28_HYPHA
MFTIICMLSLPFCCWCVEEYQREFFLGPRNFNPHPYEYQLAKIRDPGPVVFPPGEEDDDSYSNRYNIITVDDARRKYSYDSTPYSIIKEKIKYLIDRGYDEAVHENEIDDEIYDALAHQGAKVLSYPAHELQDYNDNVHLPRKNYAFAYKVLDKERGDDFSHQQVRNSKATNGEYRVKLPDGRLQIVSYKADKEGYKADVRYELDPEAQQQQVVQSAPLRKAQEYARGTQKVDITRVPVRQFAPRGQLQAIKTYDYVPEEGGQRLINPTKNPNSVTLEQVGPTRIPVKYVDYPQPTAGYYQRKTYAPQQAQAIYSNNHLKPTYVSTTPSTPSVYQKPVRYTPTPIVPTVQAQIIHNGDNGLHSRNVVSTYATPVQPAKSVPGHNNVINTLSSTSSQNDAYRQTLEQENELPEGIYIVGKTGR